MCVFVKKTHGSMFNVILMHHRVECCNMLYKCSCYRAHIAGRRTILDCGCGDGLVGVALTTSAERGVAVAITGVDISSEMLALATEKKVYAGIIKADLSKALPVGDAAFDALVCVGTTTYLDPSVIVDWIRVVKIGGLIGFTHKTAVWPSWEPRQEQLCKDGCWAEVFISEPLQYLPGYDDNARLNERCKMYFYRRVL